MTTLPIHVCSRQQAMHFTPKPFRPSLCISIGRSGKEDRRLVAGLQSKFSCLLRLRFDDIDADIDQFQAFNENLALEVVRLAHSITQDTDVLVHCEGGQSQSVATGVFFGKLLKRGLVLHVAPDYAKLNGFVLQHLKKAYLRDRVWRLRLPRYDMLSMQPAHVEFRSTTSPVAVTQN